MKLVESADGTIRLIELDPSKNHVLILDADANIAWPIRLVNGSIIVKRRGTEMQILEAERLPEIRAGG